MRKINFRGITESMSEREMKLVKGGVEPAKITVATPALTVEESACYGGTEGMICHIKWSGGQNDGVCLRDKDTQKLNCIIVKK